MCPSHKQVKVRWWRCCFYLLQSQWHPLRCLVPEEQFRIVAIRFVTKTMLDWVLVILDSVEFLSNLFPLKVELIHRIVLEVDAINIILDGGRRGELSVMVILLSVLGIGHIFTHIFHIYHYHSTKNTKRTNKSHYSEALKMTPSRTTIAQRQHSFSNTKHKIQWKWNKKNCSIPPDFIWTTKRLW